jgi:hypothetical protein
MKTKKMKRLYFGLSIIILAMCFGVSCGKNNETNYANLKGEWYSSQTDQTIIFTSDTTLTMILGGIDETQRWSYRSEPEGIIYTTYRGTTTMRNVEFISNRKIIISEMAPMFGVGDTGNAVFIKKIF